jgi:GNAT superfamily N-acetyltransferase
MSGAGLTLRDVTPADVPEVMRLLHALAVYERLEHRFVVEAAAMERALFGAPPWCAGLLAWSGGRAIGLALWHVSYDAFAGRPGFWLEELFVEPEARGQGAGRALVAELARRLAAMGGASIAWRLLRWNAPSIAFYRRLGAEPDDGTAERMTLSGEALASLAAT